MCSVKCWQSIPLLILLLLLVKDWALSEHCKSCSYVCLKRWSWSVPWVLFIIICPVKDRWSDVKTTKYSVRSWCSWRGGDQPQVVEAAALLPELEELKWKVWRNNCREGFHSETVQGKKEWDWKRTWSSLGLFLVCTIFVLLSPRVRAAAVAVVLLNVLRCRLTY